MGNRLLANPHITIFGFDIFLYAIVIVLGMIAAFFVISLLFKRRNMSADLFLTFFCIALPIAIVTTRLFYCLTDADLVKKPELWFNFESIRNGGLSIIGGIIGGTVSVAVICIVKKVNFFRVGDCVVVGLLLAQAIGRWGNYFNQEVYGMEVTNSALQWFPFAVYIDKTASWHYAFFFYESMVTFTAAALMFWHAWKNPQKPNGVNTALYFVVYGLVRSIMEPLRAPEYILGAGGVQWSFVFSMLLLIGGLGMLAILFILNKKKEGKCIGSLHGEPYGISKYIGDDKKEVAYFSKWNMMCSIYPERYEIKEKKEKTQTKASVVVAEEIEEIEEVKQTEETDASETENEI
jgi:phosphatidylglycerol:prolipoprotein diacylglycerol transferase